MVLFLLLLQVTSSAPALGERGPPGSSPRDRWTTGSTPGERGSLARPAGVGTTGTSSQERGSLEERGSLVTPGQFSVSRGLGLNVSQAMAMDSRIATGGYWEGVRWQLEHSHGIQLEEPLPVSGLSTRIGDVSVSSTPPSPEVALPAGCTPLPTPVAIELANVTAGSILFPDCTLLDRCGGCCSHHLLSCQATSKEMVEKEVTVLDLSAGQSRRERVTLERHTACGCQCTVKEHHCNSLQDYRQHECRCECRNSEQRRECWGGVRLWDEEGCVCRCTNAGSPCSTGMRFNHQSCSCESFIAGLYNDRRGRRCRAGMC